MSDAITHGVRVQVVSRYHPERSDPPARLWFFSYTVRISNLGEDTVQLEGRHLVITDANGRVEHVRGAGVVGEQPILRPGEVYEYTSACPLPTSLGAMEGNYEMRASDGTSFQARIAPFALEDPDTIN